MTKTTCFAVVAQTASRRDGRSSHPLYRTWQKMKGRCYNKNEDNYRNYGGRGITVCARWKTDFLKFLEDMGERPSGYTLDRIDVNGNYEPNNCQWASSVTQLRNTRRNASNRIDTGALSAIINSYHDEVPMRTIAKRFGIHESFVSGLVLGATLAKPMRRSYHFSEIALVPQKSQCSSRLDASIRSEVARGLYLDIPLIAANMSTVCNSSFCKQLDTLGSMGILHRVHSNTAMVKEAGELAKNSTIVAVSVGIGEEQLGLAGDLVRAGANVIVIDIANGYTDAVITLGRQIKKEFPAVRLIVGNTTNVKMLYEVDDFADAVKVGTASGLACETKNTAAFAEGQFSAVLKFKEGSKKLGLPIISDGGVREPGDLVKAIAAGANSAMAGAVFARCPESAAEVVEIEGSMKKLYAGMASRHVQNQWRGGMKEGTCPEGAVKYLNVGESLQALLNRYSGALRSGVTYSGGTNLKELQSNAEFIEMRRT